MNNEINYSKLLDEFNDLIGILSVKAIIAESHPMATGWNWETAEAYINQSGYNKLQIIRPNLAYFIDYSNDELKYHAYGYFELPDIWNKAKNSFVEKLSELAYDNDKYGLNEYFNYVFKIVNNNLRHCSLQQWLIDNDAANSFRTIILSIGDMFKAWQSVYVDLFSNNVNNVFDQAFVQRRGLMTELLGELIEIYSKHLFLPRIEKLPEIKYLGNKTDMFEVLVALDESQKFEEFPKFRSLFCEIVGIDVTQYPKMKSEINSRVMPMRFLQALIDKATKQKMKKKQKKSKNTE